MLRSNEDLQDTSACTNNLAILHIGYLRENTES